MTRGGQGGFAELVGFEAAPVQDFQVHGTTVLALRYDEGILVLADRRATMGNLIMYEHAEKILPLDDTVVVAISGAYARSIEIGRYLRHSFKYYERLNLVEISSEGKLMEISRALRGNLPAVNEGLGLFLPIAAAYDKSTDSFGVYFFDAAGARFQSSDYACAGSGSERIRGVFEYLIRTKGPWANRPFGDVLKEGLTMLDIAADLDSATGGFRKILPSAFVLDRQGVREISGSELGAAADDVIEAVKRKE
ncbi:MAG: proteasome subunit alpha [Armatimonadetes bacterium]|nr:proteasome subunit alpha [Armatimonadota bacterium]